MQQEQQQQRPPPPAYLQHDPESFHLPSVPTHTPAHHANARLPGIKALDLPNAGPRHSPHNSTDLSPRSLPHTPQWSTLPALTSATFPKVPDGMPADIGSPMDTASVLSAQDEQARRRETSVSMDDPDVRLAAEALSGLGNPDFIRSPRADTNSSTTSNPEPMLSLITSTHPWLGGTINGSISAYNLTKGYSPRFVKYGAELIERNVGSPMVNTVSSVGRRTGMEQNLRRYLGEAHRRPSDLEQGDTDAARKRQRVASPAGDAMEVDARASPRARVGSHSSYAESLPAYDDQRSPNYEDDDNTAMLDPTHKEPAQSGTTQDRRVAWSTQLIMTTSGLGVALSAASLRSLRQCLHLLRGATSHIDSVMQALKLVLEEYEAALRNRRQSDGYASPNEKHTVKAAPGAGSDKDDQVYRIAERIKALSSDIWTTLQSVVQSVSRYTGGALPQNASQVVRTQLLSVPQRWQLAGRRTAAGTDEAAGGDEGEAVRGANRMLAFATEGLDMMGQITTVVDGTVQSAESWLSRIGRGPSASQSGEGSAEQTPREKALLPVPSGDVAFSRQEKR